MRSRSVVERAGAKPLAAAGARDWSWRRIALLELAQRGTGLDAELVDECGPGSAVGLERLRLPPGPVERAHHQFTGTLPERVGVDELLGLRERVGVPAAPELDLDRALAHEHAHLLEPRAFVLEEGLIGEVGESGPTPQRERLAQQAGGLLQAAVVQSDGARACQPLEDVQVERVRLDSCHVAGASCLDRFAADCLAKLGDRPLEEIRRAVRRLVAPDGVDDARGWNHPAGVGEQDDQHASLTRPAEIDRSPLDQRRNRSEQLISDSGDGLRARRPRRRMLAVPRLDLELEGVGRNAVEGRILPEDALLEVTELTARLDPQLFHQRAARVGVGVERLRLPARPVERQHQLRAKALPQRVPLDQLLELADHGAVLTGRERVVDGELARPQPELLEAADLGSGERLVREVVERRAPPQHERLARRIVGRPLAAGSGGDQALEPQRVDRVRGHTQFIAAPAGEDLGLVPLQQLAQLRDVELHHLLCARRRPLAPQPLDQPIRRYRRVRPQGQHRHHCALLCGTQDDGPSVDGGLDQAEEPDLHR